MTTKVKWNATSEDSLTIAGIVDRVMRALAGYQQPMPDRIQLEMSLTACHVNGCPLDLNGLLISQDFDLLHDVLGINRHIDKETGKLGNCFLPRYNKKDVA